MISRIVESFVFNVSTVDRSYHQEPMRNAALMLGKTFIFKRQFKTHTKSMQP
uniref:MIP04712p n=1 Tax=Drosophila melanogaster TaxID=7227 RepID=C8VV81_DROME|nr:MIP04712p [Drosophila melanogaster]